MGAEELEEGGIFPHWEMGGGRGGHENELSVRLGLLGDVMDTLSLR